jgi:hypothetical protein
VNLIAVKTSVPLRAALLALLLALPIAPAALAQTAAPAAAPADKPPTPPAPYTGPDYSGTYVCTGEDSHDGKFTGTATLTLVRAQSSGPHGAYDFRLEAPPYGVYLGEAAARGPSMAMRFANTDPKDKDYGTAIATFSRTRAGKWRFSSYYYEPAYKGGNFGTETCVRR